MAKKGRFRKGKPTYDIKLPEDITRIRELICKGCLAEKCGLCRLHQFLSAVEMCRNNGISPQEAYDKSEWNVLTNLSQGQKKYDR